MSEDEIIKILEDACILDELCYEVDCLEEKQLEAIRGLYSLYKQEKEKNKELVEKLKMSIAMLTKGTYPETEKGANDFDNYFIRKDKIKAKIKELEEKRRQVDYETGTLYRYTIAVLNGLLEEESAEGNHIPRIY